LLFGHAALHCDTYSLSDFSSIWRANVESNNHVVGLGYKDLNVALVALWSSLVVLPFQWLELDVESLNVIGSKLVLGLNLSISTASILKRSEDTGWDVNVVHFHGCSSIKSVSKELSSFDGDWSELKLPIDDITDGIDVRNIGLLNIVDLELAVLLSDETSILHSESSGKSISSHGEEDSIVLIKFLFSFLLEGNLDLSTIEFLKLGWSSSFKEFCVTVRHEGSDSVGHVLIKTSEED